MGMNRFNSAIAAGYSRHTAKKTKDRLDNRLCDLKDYLEQEGLTDKHLAGAIIELCKATDKNGRPEWGNREKGIRLACQIKQWLTDKNINLETHTHFTKIYIPEPYDKETIERMASSSRPANRGV